MNLKNYSLEFTPDKNYLFGFKYKKILYQGKTKYQKIELFDTPLFGRLLKLDNIFQTSEGDEFLYHEPLVQVAMTSHPNPKRILIIGGGDGGALREVLKHNTVKKVTIAELDKEVVDFSKKYLKKICSKSFNDQRTNLYIGDGKKYIEESKEKFDVIIIDLTDPSGPSLALYTPEFYKTVSRHLTSQGLISLHTESPIMRKKMYQLVIGNLKKAFKVIRPFLSYIPLYGSAWGLTVASKKLDPAKIKAKIIAERLAKRRVGNLKWYSPQIHEAIFTLPPYLENIIKKL